VNDCWGTFFPLWQNEWIIIRSGHKREESSSARHSDGCRSFWLAAMVGQLKQRRGRIKGKLIASEPRHQIGCIAAIGRFQY
jgi:hypothetical protein